MRKKLIEKIILAERVRSSDLETGIENILEVLGFPGSLITDESEIGDFIDIYATEEEKEKILDRVEEQLGVSVDVTDYLVDIAERIKRTEEG